MLVYIVHIPRYSTIVCVNNYICTDIWVTLCFGLNWIWSSENGLTIRVPSDAAVATTPWNGLVAIDQTKLLCTVNVTDFLFWKVKFLLVVPSVSPNKKSSPCPVPAIQIYVPKQYIRLSWFYCLNIITSHSEYLRCDKRIVHIMQVDVASQVRGNENILIDQRQPRNTSYCQ